MTVKELIRRLLEAPDLNMTVVVGERDTVPVHINAVRPDADDYTGICRIIASDDPLKEHEVGYPPLRHTQC